MSLLAGFDFAAELSNAALLRFLENVSLPGGLSLATPFEITSGDPTTQGAHFLFEQVELNLLAHGMVKVTMTFADSSVAVPNLSDGSTNRFANAEGTVVFQVPLTFRAPTGASSPKTLFAVFSAIEPTQTAVTFTNPAAFQPPLPATVTPASVAGLINLFGIWPMLHDLGDVSLGVSFPIVASGDGTLSPALSFLDVQLVTIANADRAQQALVILGTLVSESVGAGHVADKTTTAITAGHGFALSLSPNAFKKLLFCPGVAANFTGGDISLLPTPCGGAGTLSVQGVDISSIVCSFADAGVSVDIAGTHTAAEFVATIAIHGAMSFTASGESVTASVHFDDPQIDVQLAWWEVLGSILTGGLWAGAAAIVDAVNGEFDGGDNRLADINLSSVLPSFSGLALTLDAASATSEGLTLEGTIPLAAPRSAQPWLELRGSVTTPSRTATGSGNFTTTVGCPIGTYPYTEYAQEQSGDYEAIGHLVGTPLQITWSIISDDYTEYPLAPEQSSIELEQQRCYFVMPLPGGSPPIARRVHLDYRITGDTIHLTSRPDDGIYTVTLRARARSPGGTLVEQTADLAFQGDAVDIGGTWANDCASCIRSILQRVRGEERWPRPFQIPRWSPVNYPTELSLTEMVAAVLAVGGKDAAGIAQRAMVAHGSSGYRALFGFQRRLANRAAAVVARTQQR